MIIKALTTLAETFPRTILKDKLAQVRKFYPVLIASIILSSIFSLFFISAFASGDGTSSNPYQINNWTDLNSTRDNLTASYILMNNLSSSDSDYLGIGDSWQPIGNATAFSGNFNGSNHIISDLIINLPSNNVGLFGNFSGTIYNIGLINVNITGNNNVGSLVGFSSGTISNCYSNGTVTGSNFIGGLVGNLTGGISNSYSLTNVYGLNYIGGLIGYFTGTVTNSYSTGKVIYNSASPPAATLILSGLGYGSIS